MSNDQGTGSERQRVENDEARMVRAGLALNEEGTTKHPASRRNGAAGE